MGEKSFLRVRRKSSPNKGKRSRRGARAAEWAGLENRCRGNPTEGSNPSLSAWERLKCRDHLLVADAHPIITYDLIDREPITVYPFESCRTAAERMAQARVGRLPVVSPHHRTRVIGMVTRSDLLKPRARHVEEEVKRERFLGRWLGAFDRPRGTTRG